MIIGDSDFRPRYGYKWWMNGIPCTRKYLIDTMEYYYKKKEEEKKYEEQARFIQQQLTEQ